MGDWHVLLYGFLIWVASTVSVVFSGMLLIRFFSNEVVELIQYLKKIRR